MCLLVALSGVLPAAPLIMAANRDESLARPAVAMTALQEAGPRILGGRDELAGGTWLAVNEHGVVAGLTNRPSAGGRDAARRSRGEIPLAFAAHPTAAEAIRAVSETLDPSAYNPCWLLVGDRHQLFFVEIADGPRPQVEELGPGLHILENVPLRAPSAKAEQVARLVAAERAARAAGPGPAPGESADTVADALEAVLRDHHPAGPASGPAVAGPDGRPLPPAISAACVHAGQYGTRSSLIVTVPGEGRPVLRVADGPPCQAPLRDVTRLWTGPALV
ncbi:MAG TPA: NRDE family protein [Streptosporangiaceae bacterium]|jgi:uncharacterized protein with NRDE domain